MNETLRKFLEALRKRGATPTHKHAGTADAYVSTLRRCVSGLCPTDGWQAGQFASVLKAAADTPVYRNDGMGVKQFMSVADASKTWKDAQIQLPNGPAPLMVFDAVLTSNRKDRDSDILEPAGAEIDPRAPLLWQHDPVHPIGRLVAVGERSSSQVTGGLAIADIPLGRDSAYLVEFGALRISHGFRPRKFEPITEKSGSTEIVSGFHVIEYEMMEVSLVSVPSNVDAVITAFSAGKLHSSLAKSWAGQAFASRKRFLDAGWNGQKFTRPTPRLVKTTELKCAAKTGKKRVELTTPKGKKDAAEFETAIGDAMATIVHSGDYGYGFYKPTGNQPDTPDQAGVNTFDVYWTMGDADTGTSPDGTPYTTSDEIKQLLGGVTGVGEVTVESEVSPPKGEGWKMVFPEVKDWTEEPAQNSEPAAGGDGGAGGSNAQEPPAGGGDDGKAKKKPTKKDGQPVSGSFEHVADALREAASAYLLSQGIQIDPNEPVSIAATYPDHVIVCVGCEQDAAPTGSETYYSVPYTQGADGPAFSGPPSPVELELTVSNSAPASNPAVAGTPPADSIVGPPVTAPAAGGDGAGGDGKSKKRPVARWVPLGTAGKNAKGKLGKKDHGILKEAIEHFDDALSRPMPNVIKTLVSRGCMMVKEVCDSDGSSGDQPATPDGTAGQTPAPEGMSDTQRALWAQIGKLARGGWVKNRLTIALLLDQLSASCVTADREEELQQLLNPAQ